MMTYIKPASEESSNEYYGRLNEQFDLRAGYLRNKGFTYEHVAGYDMAAFVRRNPAKKLPFTIPAAFVMHADQRSWADRCEDIDRAFPA
jgi:hypothetical protein